MPKSYNKVILLGNVGQDPDVFSANGGIGVNISLATDESFRVNLERRERTEWHSLVAFHRLAEVVRDYVQKGSKIHIEGKLRTDHWDDRDSGEPRSKTRVEILDLTLLSSLPTQSLNPSYSRSAEPVAHTYAQVGTAEELTTADIPY